MKLWETYSLYGFINKKYCKGMRPLGVAFLLFFVYDRDKSSYET